MQVIDRTIEWQKLAATLEEVKRIRVHDVLNETYGLDSDYPQPKL